MAGLPSGENKKRIMLLDDEKFLVEMYKLSFEKNGYEVYAYHDVDDALKALRDGLGPDVILFDITMPDGRSGYEFIETIKTEGLSKRSIKIALTNEAQSGEKMRLKELGADEHLVKASFIPSELVHAVEKMLQMETPR